MQRRIRDGFSILIPAADAVWIFGAKLKISLIKKVPKAYRQPRLILNLSTKPDKDTPIVNDTTDKNFYLESMKFGRAFPCTLESIWEADPVQGPVQVLKIDVTYLYRPGTLWTSQVGGFMYVIPSATGDKGCIICITLVLPLGWVDSPKFSAHYLRH